MRMHSVVQAVSAEKNHSTEAPPTLGWPPSGLLSPLVSPWACNSAPASVQHMRLPVGLEWLSSYLSDLFIES